MSDLPLLYPCHLHSWFSLGDSVISPKNITKRMKELGIDKEASTAAVCHFGQVTISYL